MSDPKIAELVKQLKSFTAQAIKDAKAGRFYKAEFYLQNALNVSKNLQKIKYGE